MEKKIIEGIGVKIEITDPELGALIVASAKRGEGKSGGIIGEDFASVANALEVILQSFFESVFEVTEEDDSSKAFMMLAPIAAEAMRKAKNRDGQHHVFEEVFKQ